MHWHAADKKPDVEPKSPSTDDGLTRRSLVRASAWSIPVIAVAVASPLAAASVAAFTGTISFPGQLALAISSKVSPWPQIDGLVQVTGGALPSSVTFVYGEYFSGPAVALVQSDGTFQLNGVSATPAAFVAGALSAVTASSPTTATYTTVITPALILLYPDNGNPLPPPPFKPPPSFPG
jgi:hypothetical protein